jgi:hypothetical protein
MHVHEKDELRKLFNPTKVKIKRNLKSIRIKKITSCKVDQFQLVISSSFEIKNLSSTLVRKVMKCSISFVF